MEWLKRKLGFLGSEERGKKVRFEEPKDNPPPTEEDFVQVNLPESPSNPIMQPVSESVEGSDRIGLAAIPQIESQSPPAPNQQPKKQAKQTQPNNNNNQQMPTKQPKKPPRTPQSIIHQPK